MFSRKFRYKLTECGVFYCQTKVWYWPIWIDVYKWSMESFVKGWAVNPCTKWKYLDEKDMKTYV